MNPINNHDELMWFGKRVISAQRLDGLTDVLQGILKSIESIIGEKK
jgi:hypothetical protein